MLAMFEGRLANRPECMMMPHKDAVSALKDDFLVNHFTSVYPDSIVISSESSFTFAYSGGASSSSCPERRYRLAHTDGVYCMYQGFIKDIDAAKQDFHISDIDDEGIVMIRAFQILRRLGQRIPKKAFEDMSGNSFSVFYEIPSKLIVLAGGSYHDVPIYWGIDARFNIVISDNEKVAEKACVSVQAFLKGQVYACCKGRTGKEALFLNKQLPFKVDFTDKYFPISKPVKTIRQLIFQADDDRSNARKWEPPLPDFVKINTDAVEFRDGTVGIGIVIRNSKGEVEFAITRQAENEYTEMGPELQAFIEGFYVVSGYKLPRCIFETVHLNVGTKQMGLAWAIIEERLSKVYDYVAESLCEFSMSFVRSSANQAAYRLSLNADKESHRFWKNKTPECIASIVESERPDSDTISCAFQELEI